MKVISQFVDKRTGHRVNPGDAVPEGLDPETIRRLVKAQCLALTNPVVPPNSALQPKTGVKPSATAAAKPKAKAKAKAKAAATPKS